MIIHSTLELDLESIRESGFIKINSMVDGEHKGYITITLSEKERSSLKNDTPSAVNHLPQSEESPTLDIAENDHYDEAEDVSEAKSSEQLVEEAEQVVSEVYQEEACSYDNHPNSSLMDLLSVDTPPTIQNYNALKDCMNSIDKPVFPPVPMDLLEVKKERVSPVPFLPAIVPPITEDKQLEEYPPRKRIRGSRQLSVPLKKVKLSQFSYNSTMDKIETIDFNMFRDEVTKKFVCPYCQYAIPQGNGFRNHMFAHMGIKPFSCPLCSVPFRQNAHLKLHLQHHSVAEAHAARISLIICPKMENKLFYHCTFCDRKFAKYLCKKDHEPKCPYNPRSTAKTKMASAVQSALKQEPRAWSHETKGVLTEMLRDTIAGVSYTDINKLTPASTKHASGFKCSDCAYISSDFDKVFSHYNQEHTGIKLYHCPMCFEEYTTAEELMAHFDTCDKQMFICRWCKKIAVSLSGSIEHYYSCKMNELFSQCRYCNVIMSSKDNLHRHHSVCQARMMSDSQGDSPKVLCPFRCHLCKKPFLFRSLLDKHQQQCDSAPVNLENASMTSKSTGEDHKPYDCKYCPAKFETYLKLRSHMLVHKNDTSLKCSRCGLKLPNRLRLNAHKKLNCPGRNDTSTIKCHKCGSSFSSRMRLFVHKKIHCGGVTPDDIPPDDEKSDSLIPDGMNAFECVQNSLANLAAEQGQAAEQNSTQKKPLRVAKAIKTRVKKKTPQATVKVEPESEQVAEQPEVSSVENEPVQRKPLKKSKKNINDVADGLITNSSPVQALPSQETKSPRSKRECGPCEICGKILSKAYMYQHMHMYHKDAKPKPCPLCHRVFFLQSSFETHIQQAHCGEVFCDGCKKPFSSRLSLKFHQTRSLTCRAASSSPLAENQSVTTDEEAPPSLGWLQKIGEDLGDLYNDTYDQMNLSDGD